MARTLFIVRDDVFRNLPSRITDGVVAEVRRLFRFLANFTVSVLEPVGFPERLDFTDSIVKIIEDDDGVTAAVNQARQIELDNLVFSAQQHGIRLNTPPPSRSAAMPDRGGLSFQQKEIVDPTNLRLIITITGGVASLETAKQEVLEFTTGGRTLADIEQSRNKAMFGPSGKPQVRIVGGERETSFPDARYFASYQALVDARDELTWGLIKRDWRDWSNDLQDAVAVALGRLIAHEARHQYIMNHSSSGLGADEAILFGQRSFENFEKGDQSDITARLVALNKQQSAGTTHLDTLPRGRQFPFA